MKEEKKMNVVTEKDTDMLLIFFNKVNFLGYEFNAPITADELVKQWRQKLREEIKINLDNNREWQQYRYNIRNGLF